MARAKKEDNQKETQKYTFEYYIKPENWAVVEEVLATCFKKSEVLLQLQITDSVFQKLIMSKGFNDFIEIRDHYRNGLVREIGIQFFKKIKSGLASEKLLTFAMEKIFLPEIERQKEEERKSTDGGVIIEKPIFDFSDGNIVSLEEFALRQQQNIQEALDRERKEEENATD